MLLTTINTHMKRSIYVALALIIAGCGGGSKETVTTVPAPVESKTVKTVITAKFKPSTHVVGRNAANAVGRFNQPYDGELFTGNILTSVTVDDPEGLAAVALSFNQTGQLKYLCDASAPCPIGQFNKLETNINPADFGVYVSPLTVGLWALDSDANQMLLDSVTLDWQLRRVTGVNASRSDDGTSITVNWPTNSELLRHNVLIAAQPNVTINNYAALQEGQGFLSLTSQSQIITNLDPNTTYFLMVTGVDGSGESAFSSELRFAPPSGQNNTPPVATEEQYSSPENQSLAGNVLLNDTDLNGDVLSISPLPIQFPLNGMVTLNTNGTFEYTPANTFSGLDSFVYEVQDGQGGVSQGVVNISIDNVNDAPTAAPDSYSTPQNTLLNVTAPGLLSNDIDIDGDAISVNTAAITLPQNGTLMLAANGSFTYTPNQDFSGNDSFTYQISDPSGLTDTAVVTITVGASNAPPTAVNDSYVVDEDTTLLADNVNNDGVLANDSDLDNDPLIVSASLIESVANGVLTIDQQGLFTYIPNSNFYGNDFFIYQIEDGQGNTAQATVSITVNPVNDLPTPVDDNYSVAQDTVLNINAPGLLSNDLDLENDNLTVDTTAVSQPSSGSIALQTNGGFTYTPNTGFSGNDSFTYRVNDGSGFSSAAQVSITVTQASAELSGVSLTAIGELRLDGLGETSSGSGIGQVRYSLGDCVQTSFTECTLSGRYQENSDSGFTPNATGNYTMVLSYAGTGPSPIIAESTTPGGDTVSFSTIGDGQFVLTLMPDTGGEIKAFFPDSIPANTINFGAFLASGPTCSGLNTGQTCRVGEVGLTPDSIIQRGVNPFTFTIPNPQLNNNVAPTAQDDTATTNEDEAVTLDVLSNDSDVDGDALEVIDASANNGDVLIEADGKLTYTPNTNFNGADVISYTIYDGNGHTDSASVSVTVAAINDTPTVANETGLILNSVQPMIIDVLANDADVDLDTLSILDVSVSSGSGTVDLVNGAVFYHPSGIATEGSVTTISYTVIDGNGGQAAGTAQVAIGNTWPTVNPDRYLLMPDNRLVVDNTTLFVPMNNDTDVNPSDVLSFKSVVASVRNGTFTASASAPSGFDYTPTTNYVGIDGGFYEINDGSGNDGEGLFSIKVSNVDWDNQIALPNVPRIDMLDLEFDGVNYALFNNDYVTQSPANSSGYYYAISGRTIMSTQNLQDWQVEYATNGGGLRAIASGYTVQNPSVETIIAVGDFGTYLIKQRSESTSTDWVELPFGINLRFNNIQFNGTQFMAVGNNIVAVSDNGYQWLPVTTANVQEYNDVMYDRQQYIIVGDAGGIETSSDGLTWLPQTSGTTERLNAIAYNSMANLGVNYVAVGDGGAIVTSSTGMTWSTASSGVTQNLNTVNWNGTQYVIAGDGNTVLTSSDGVSWTQQSGIDTANVQAVVWDGSQYVFGSNNGDLFTSADAQSYSPVNLGFDENMSGLAFNGVNTFVRAGNPSYIYRSTNGGTSWAQATALGVQAINQVRYFNGVFIAVGDAGLIWFSSDGNNWTPQNSGTTENLHDVYWHNGQDLTGQVYTLYVAVGTNGTILTSQTGVTWAQEQILPFADDTLFSVTHDNNSFIAVGQAGRVVTRDNNATPGGSSWLDTLTNPTWENLNSIFFNGNNLVIVGDNGRLVTGNTVVGLSSGANLGSLDLLSVHGSNTVAVASGRAGSMYYSLDGGGAWLPLLQATEIDVHEVVYDVTNNTVYGVGDLGVFIKGRDNF